MATVSTATMSAIAIDGYGDRSRLLFRDLPIPEPQRDEVRIRVRAAGVGIWDAMRRMGELAPEHPTFPMVLGAECAGTIDAVGPGGDGRLRNGQEVYAYSSGSQGTYAQYVCVKSDFVAVKPRKLSFVEAAAVPVDGITAHQALVDALRVGTGESVLIAGASGGVGTLAVQIAAKALGARVIATAGKANLDYVRELGATDVIDYTSGDVVSAVMLHAADGVAAALDCVGRGDNAKTTIHAVREGGRLAELVGEVVPAERNIAISHIQATPSAKRLDTLRKLIEDGSLRVVIDKTFPLADAHLAHEAIEARHTRGKIVLVVD